MFGRVKRRSIGSCSVNHASQETVGSGIWCTRGASEGNGFGERERTVDGVSFLADSGEEEEKAGRGDVFQVPFGEFIAEAAFILRKGFEAMPP